MDNIERLKCSAKILNSKWDSKSSKEKLQNACRLILKATELDLPLSCYTTGLHDHTAGNNANCLLSTAQRIMLQV